MTTTEPRHHTVEIRFGHPALVGAAWVTVIDVDPPLVCLGVDDPGGAETTAWYAPGHTLTTGGHRWRVLRTDVPVAADPDVPPGAGGGHAVAVLVRVEGEC